jgi:hypothetical protein
MPLLSCCGLVSLSTKLLGPIDTAPVILTCPHLDDGQQVLVAVVCDDGETRRDIIEHSAGVWEGGLAEPLRLHAHRPQPPQPPHPLHLLHLHATDRGER